MVISLSWTYNVFCNKICILTKYINIVYYTSLDTYKTLRVKLCTLYWYTSTFPDSVWYIQYTTHKNTKKVLVRIKLITCYGKLKCTYVRTMSVLHFVVRCYSGMLVYPRKDTCNQLHTIWCNVYLSVNSIHKY